MAMILRGLLGAVAAAVAMFVLGFVFFASGLQNLAIGDVDNMQAATIRQALAANLPETGTFSVPDDSTAEQTVMYGQGPIATIHYNSRGFAIGDPLVLLGGFMHMLIVALIMAAGLLTLSKYVASQGERIRLLLLGAIGAAVFIHLREPIWFHHDWTYAIYVLIADVVSLTIGGLIILKLLPRQAMSAAGASA
jgi:general stress protein CsbA